MSAATIGQIARPSADRLPRNSVFPALLLQKGMEAQMDFFGHGVIAGIFVKGDGLLEGIDEKEARMAVFHMRFEFHAELRVKFPFNVFRNHI
jgi:hypothetical protein